MPTYIEGGVMIDPESDLGKRLIFLANEIQMILEENLPKDHQHTDETAACVRYLAKQIQKEGCMARWDATLDPETLEIKVNVEIFQPRDDMSEEHQKLYDDWYEKVNGFSFRNS